MDSEIMRLEDWSCNKSMFVERTCVHLATRNSQLTEPHVQWTIMVSSNILLQFRQFWGRVRRTSIERVPFVEAFQRQSQNILGIHCSLIKYLAVLWEHNGSEFSNFKDVLSPPRLALRIMTDTQRRRSSARSNKMSK